MNVTWAIEEEIWNDNSVALLSDALDGLGIPYFKVSQQAHWDHVSGKPFLPEYDKEDCIIFYGSLQVAKDIMKTKPWIPGASIPRRTIDVQNIIQNLDRLSPTQNI